MADKSQLWLDFICKRRVRMLIDIKQVDIATDGFRCNDILSLRHESSSIDLSLVIDLLSYLNPRS